VLPALAILVHVADLVAVIAVPEELPRRAADDVMELQGKAAMASLGK
jgi:hypothetical protein